MLSGQLQVPIQHPREGARIHVNYTCEVARSVGYDPTGERAFPCGAPAQVLCEYCGPMCASCADETFRYHGEHKLTPLPELELPTARSSVRSARWCMSRSVVRIAGWLGWRFRRITGQSRNGSARCAGRNLLPSTSHTDSRAGDCHSMRSSPMRVNRQKRSPSNTVFHGTIVQIDGRRTETKRGN